MSIATLVPRRASSGSVRRGRSVSPDDVLDAAERLRAALEALTGEAGLTSETVTGVTQVTAR